MSSLRSKKGFTLIELLIVVVIIGILATILISRFSGAKDAAYAASVNSVAQQVSQAVMAYNALQTTADICDTQAKLEGMADDLTVAKLAGAQITCTCDGTDWTITHAMIPANTATVNATSGAITAATL